MNQEQPAALRRALLPLLPCSVITEKNSNAQDSVRASHRTICCYWKTPACGVFFFFWGFELQWPALEWGSW